MKNKSNRLKYYCAILLLVALSGCKHKDTHDQHDEKDKSLPANEIIFTEEQKKEIDFATEQVVRRAFGQVIKVAARIEPAQGDEQLVVAKTAGIVILSAVNCVEGSSVRAGQRMFSISAKDVADNNLSVRYQEVINEYERSKAEFERVNKLVADKLVSEAQYLRAKTAYQNAEAAFRNMQKNFSAGSQSVSSPITGFIKQIPVKNGQFVSMGQTVAVISQNRKLFIKAEVQPKYYALLNGAITANIKTLADDKVYDLQDMGGKIVSFGKSLNEDNPMVTVVFQVENKAGLLPGSFVEMYMKTKDATEVLTIPNDGLVEEMGSYFVFVQLKPELYLKMPVAIGCTDGVRTEIISGLKGGETVVSKGAVFLKLSQASGGLDVHSGHAH